MARLNEVRLVGFLLKNPTIINEGKIGEEKISIKIRTTNRRIDGYRGKHFQDILLFYDEPKLMPRLKQLKMLDLIDVEGVLNIATLNETSRCPICGETNIKYYTPLVCVRPKSFIKLNGLQTTYEEDNRLPEMILSRYYQETSNKIQLIGNVMTDPELIGTDAHPICRYCIKIEREYYIHTQSQLTADYPWVYTFSSDAKEDVTHLKQGSLIHIRGYLQSEKVNALIQCKNCHTDYTYPNQRVSVIPYSVNYLAGYMTEKDIAMEMELKEKMEIYRHLND